MNGVVTEAPFSLKRALRENYENTMSTVLDRASVAMAMPLAPPIHTFQGTEDEEEDREEEDSKEDILLNVASAAVAVLQPNDEDVPALAGMPINSVVLGAPQSDSDVPKMPLVEFEKLTFQKQ
ncbi:hypothetical protein LXA43DRAFT_1067828 [Ganoderma leucocontextum]|nr:hypothetical protein LXA43DRAFT_1067828 [Ganoderma leucocontextum]